MFDYTIRKQIIQYASAYLPLWSFSWKNLLKFGAQQILPTTSKGTSLVVYKTISLIVSLYNITWLVKKNTKLCDQLVKTFFLNVYTPYYKSIKVAIKQCCVIDISKPCD